MLCITFLILILIPGLALLLTSWIILTTSIVAYIRFKMNIQIENNEMEDFFDEPYRLCKKNYPRTISFPI